MHSTRLITALVAIPLLVLLIFVGGSVFSLFIAAVAVITLWEYYRIVFNRSGRSPLGLLPWIGYIAAVLVIGAAHADAFDLLFGVLAANTLAAGVTALARFPRDEAIFDGVSRQVMGVAYVPMLLSSVVFLRSGADGVAWIFFLLFLVFVGDTGAYYAGRHLGRHKLWPSVSPKKTVEGALGGLGASMAVGALFRTLFLPHLAWGGCLALFLCIGVVGPLGDLFASVLKRSGDIKDSGNILPGHGGLLDRIDALLFAAPVAYFFKAYVF